MHMTQFNPSYGTYVLYHDGGPEKNVKKKKFMGGSKNTKEDSTFSAASRSTWNCGDSAVPGMTPLSSMGPVAVQASISVGFGHTNCAPLHVHATGTLARKIIRMMYRWNDGCV